MPVWIPSAYAGVIRLANSLNRKGLPASAQDLWILGDTYMTDTKAREKSNLKKIAIGGIFAAFVFIGTELHIPTAIGFMNLGDAVIFLAAYLIGPAAILPAAIGSALGDLLAGYPIYIVPTFVIKGLMALITALIINRRSGKKITFMKRLTAGLASEALMIAGYFAFELFLYGLTAAAGSILFNLIQALAALVVAIPLTYVLRLKL